MSDQTESNTSYKAFSLSAVEESNINQKVKFELAQVIFRMIKLGGIINILASLFVALALYNKVSTHILISWCLTIFIINLINIAFAFAYNYYKVPSNQITPWCRAHHLILALLCLAWGSIGAIFSSHDPSLQLYTITFLQVALIAFSLGTITDFTSSLIGTICVLIPYAGFRLYMGIHSELTSGYDPALNLSFSISLSILGIFLLVASYVGYSLLKKFFKVSFINVMLTEKLEQMNKFLEQRVKERTIELEDSLKLVTYQSTHDLLTDLPNQRLLLEHMQLAIDSAYENKQTFAVACIFLNEIEKINDGLGHQAGDLVIKTIAQRFQQLTKKSDPYKTEHLRQLISLSRKDIFVMLIEPISDTGEIEEKIENLFSILNTPIFIENQPRKLTSSIGVSLYPRDGRDVKTLLMNADAAMSRAKQQGGNSFNIYKSDINADFSKNLEIESYLHNALKNNEFKLQYQPFVNLKTGRICGAEALLRWKSPLGSISPDIFIPIAEANGIIFSLGEWVFRNACEQIKEWNENGFDSLKFAINLSAKQLHQKNFLQMIDGILKENKINPKYIELELTETEVFKEETIPIIKQLKAMGLSLSIDDFGTGYSGLSNLKLFSIDKLKIDKSFIRDLATNNDSKAIVASTIALAKEINVSILAEGVETKEQLGFLIENGCDMLQGYYFSKPVDASDFTNLLKNKTALIFP